MSQDNTAGAGDCSVATAGSAADHAREAVAITTLKRSGFTGDFVASDGELRLAGTDRRFRPEDLRIRNHFRFEGTSDPGDMSIVYALEARDGTRGILVDAFGTYADPAVGAVVSRMETDPPGDTTHHLSSMATIAAGGALIIATIALLGWLAGRTGRIPESRVSTGVNPGRRWVARMG
jgi:hypothetical protein